MAGEKPEKKKEGGKEGGAAGTDEPYKTANPGDTATTKGLLDDAVVQAFEYQGFPEDHRLSNVKLGLGFIACLLALVAQFWPNPLKPMPFPESRPLLLVCCVTYFAISFGLQAITSFYEKDAILFTLNPNETSPWWSTMKGHRVKVSTTLPRFSLDYTLSLQVTNDKGEIVDHADTKMKLTDYFEENGTFHEDFFMDDVDDAIADIAKGKKKTQ